jgi:hypothetical protein
MTWQDSKHVPGAVDSVGGNGRFRIIPARSLDLAASGFILIAVDHKTPEGQVWTRRFATLDDAKQHAATMEPNTPQ